MRTHEGFTLLEMAIVIGLMGLVAGAGLSIAGALRTNNGIAATRIKQQAIKEALITFIARHRRLPCPAIEALAPGAVGYGVESGGGPVDCTATPVAGGTVHRGVVPWVSLGLPDADALDGWNDRFSYFVVQAATANPTPATPLSGMRGAIALHSRIPAGLPWAPVLGLPPTGNQINACSTTAGDNGCNNAA
ncbi:MAG: type II secretion system protein, partial [Gammaproteobacteria bacterium]